MARGVCHLAQKIFNLNRGYLRGLHFSADLLGNVGESLEIPIRSDPLLDIGNPATYV